MLSSVFVDRPRLAMVIAIVTTIAGLVSLFGIPVAQYPDIVPPQVSVTTFYPGASAAVVEATVALILERLASPEAPARQVVIQGELVIRRSCRLPPGMRPSD